MPDPQLNNLRSDLRWLFFRTDLLVDGLWGRYWLDAALILALLLGGAALCRDKHIHPPAPGLVANQHGVNPFHVIELEDLRLAGQGDSPPPMEKASAMVGRYSLTYVPGGAPIDPKQLSSGARLSNELKNRVLVRLKVQVTNLFAGMRPPFTATLMGSPTERATTALLERDVIVLDLQPAGDGMAAVLAVVPADEPTITAFIGRSDLLLVVERR